MGPEGGEEGVKRVGGGGGRPLGGCSLGNLVFQVRRLREWLLLCSREKVLQTGLCSQPLLDLSSIESKVGPRSAWDRLRPQTRTAALNS